jgi:biopolymer transport protein ExbB
MDLADLFEQGGPLMWGILVASIVGVAVFLERLWSLQRARVLPRAFVDRIRGLVSKRKTSEALLLCEENGSSIALLMAAALRTHQYGKSRAASKEAVEEVGNREVAHMDRNVEIVGTVASITPLMGLLGTVIGMISVFQNFVESYKSGMVGPDTFAEGIWQALITTAFGLTVAIPMLLAYKFLQGRNDRLVVEMEEDAMGIVDLLEDAQRPNGDRARGRARGDERDGRAESDRDDDDDADDAEEARR